MPSTIVACQRCASYEEPGLSQAIAACLEPLGGFEARIRPGDRVFCKVNLLMPAAPERAITTHPAVLRAVIRGIREAGGEPVVGDNPAGPGLRTHLSRCGLLSVIEEEGAEIADMQPTVEIRSKRAVGRRTFEVSQAVLDADVLVNLPKFKSHALVYMTLATKNLFGLVPGLEKARWHMRAQKEEDFASLLVDLYAAVLDAPRRPREILHLLDGVLALEGDGPGMGGQPRPLGVLLAGTDAVAVDRVACRVANLEPHRLYTCALASERDLGVGELSCIEVKGAPLEQVEVHDFQAAVGRDATNVFAQWALSNNFLRNRLIERPLVDAEGCVSCGVCVRICPASAIDLRPPQKKAAIDYGRCIRCYCCAETCPEGAIAKSPPPLLGRLLISGWLVPAAIGLVAGVVLALALLVVWVL